MVRERTATCRCGQLRATTRGEPVRVAVCHCLECQKRSGSAFAVLARWPEADVRITGEARSWTRTNGSGQLVDDRFCPTCGATLACRLEAMPGLVAIPVGAFADPGFPAPAFSVWEERKHPWVAIRGEAIEHIA